MSLELLHEQELVIHVFAHGEGPLAALSSDAITRMWSRCQTELGMAHPVPGLGLPAEPTRLNASGSAILAAAQRADTDAQAILRKEHDVLNLSVLLALPGAGWIGLDQLANGLLGPLGESDDALIGSARLFLGKVPGDDQVTASSQLGMAAAGLLPTAEQRAGWWRHGIGLASGLALWELATRPDSRAHRRLLVLAPPDRDADLSAWTWSDGTAPLPPFGRYLMHTAKLRYEMRVHARFPPATDLSAQADEWMAQMATSGPAAEHAQPPAERARLAQVLAALRAMRHTVEIAEANATAVVAAAEGPLDSRRADLLVDDRAACVAFAQRLDDDIFYLSTAEQGLRSMSTLAGPAGPPPRGTPIVFINYRVQEHPGYAILLQRELTQRFGEGSGFLAPTSVRAGDNFVREVFDRLQQSQVLFALIGQRWLEFHSSPHDYYGFGPDHDWVHHEIAEAFRLRKRVIPVLIDDAELPAESSLPPDIAGLATCQAVRLRHDSVETDLNGLFAELVRAVPSLANR